MICRNKSTLQHLIAPTYYSKKSTCSIIYCNKEFCFNKIGCQKYIISSLDIYDDLYIHNSKLVECKRILLRHNSTLQ